MSGYNFVTQHSKSSRGESSRDNSVLSAKTGLSEGTAIVDSSSNAATTSAMATAATASSMGTSSIDDTPTALLEQLVYVDNFLQSNNNDPISDSPNFEEQLSAELAAFADDEFIFPDEDKPKKPVDDSGDAGGNNNQSSWQFIDNSTNQPSSLPISGSSRDSRDPHNSVESFSGPSSFQQTAFNNVNVNSTEVPGTIQELLGHSGFSRTSQTQTRQSFNATQALLGSLGATDSSIAQVQQMLPRVEIPQGAQNTLAAAGLSQTQIEALATLIACHKNDLLRQSEGSSGPTVSHSTTSTQFDTHTQSDPLASLAQNAESPLSRHAEFLAQSLLNPRPFLPRMEEDYQGNSARNNGSLPPGIASNFAATAQTFPLAMSPTPVAMTMTTTENSTPSSTIGSNTRPSLQNSFSNVDTRSRATQRGSVSSVSTSPFSSDSKGDVEKDKRRRNTAASARFRIKKKVKEQEMERSLKELSDMSKNLEVKIQQLQMENKLMRNLVIEKNHQRDTDEVERLKKKAKLSVAMENDEPKGYQTQQKRRGQYGYNDGNKRVLSIDGN
ncbi:hypothetical protein FOA43_002328 [Brettanomyces nanus]|uniref:BZIP domain-containing protein n=1 Tax=Eeniella nana TaxID=13502 RepID=A0A875S210_EENNA|nr:uncharacterized protein FOA43_002328 [Brettanomyces nanus]QPG74988.1 hypothetical protein FOA43_002328 [Brettanomyces nanus]